MCGVHKFWWGHPRLDHLHRSMCGSRPRRRTGWTCQMMLLRSRTVRWRCSQCCTDCFPRSCNLRLCPLNPLPWLEFSSLLPRFRDSRCLKDETLFYKVSEFLSGFARYAKRISQLSRGLIIIIVQWCSTSVPRATSGLRWIAIWPAMSYRKANNSDMTLTLNPQ